MSSEIEDLLDSLVPGAGSPVGRSDGDGPGLPAGLGLEVRGLLGRGSSGWVYRAWDPVLGREVAVKVAAAEGGASTRQAVLAEAQQTATLTHPAVLPVHRVVVEGGLLCVLYRLAPAEVLTELLADWRADPEDAWSQSRRLVLLRTVVDAVAAAHAESRVHGDLKPDNIVLGEHDEPYVLDWSGLLWTEGSFSGTASHAAPEQLQGGEAIEASDVYSAAVLVWEVLTLRSFRRRQRREELGAFLARARQLPLPDLQLVGDPALAGVLQLCLASDPRVRPVIGELLAVLDGVITGRTIKLRQREEADALLAEAREFLVRFYEEEPRLTDERRVVEVHRARIPAHAPLSDKDALWRAEDRAEQIVREQGRRWLESYERAVAAIALVPDDEDAHRLLADLWWERLIFAENRGYEVEALLCLHNLARHDRGKYASRLQDLAKVSLSVDALEGTVTLHMLVVDGRRLVPRHGVCHGLPLREHHLSVGSWLAEVRAPGRHPVRVPLAPVRGGHERSMVRMPMADDVLPGWVFVPGGPFRMGSDLAAHEAVAGCTPWVDDLLVAELPVTSGDYLVFLAEQPEQDLDALVPSQRGPWGEEIRWPRDHGGVRLPDGWTPQHPVVGIDFAAALRYASWLSDRLGRTVRLPTEEEWEKAARGVDARAWPWGDVFDPGFCHMRTSLAGVPSPGPVGAFASDISVYGVRDCAGGVREWTTTTWGDGRAVVRGGSWRSDPDDCRIASRAALPREAHDPEVGVRLVMSLRTVHDRRRPSSIVAPGRAKVPTATDGSAWPAACSAWPRGRSPCSVV